MKTQQVMFSGFILAVGTLVSLTFGGEWLGTTETDWADAFVAFKQASFLGIWSVPVPNVSFFLVGAGALQNLDFAFFADGMALFQWLLMMTLGLGLTWGFFVIVIGVVQGLFRR